MDGEDGDKGRETAKNRASVSHPLATRKGKEVNREVYIAKQRGKTER